MADFPPGASIGQAGAAFLAVRPTPDQFSHCLADTPTGDQTPDIAVMKLRMVGLFTSP